MSTAVVLRVRQLLGHHEAWPVSETAICPSESSERPYRSTIDQLKHLSRRGRGNEKHRSSSDMETPIPPMVSTSH